MTFGEDIVQEATAVIRLVVFCEGLSPNCHGIPRLYGYSLIRPLI